MASTSFLSDAHSAISAGRAGGQFVGGDEPQGTAALVQEKLSTAKDTFFAKARDRSRLRQVSEAGVFQSGAGASSGSGAGSMNNTTNQQQQQQQLTSFASSDSFTTSAGKASAAQIQAERRAQIVRNVVEGSSVFNVDASSQKLGFVTLGGGEQFDARQSVLTFPGINNKPTSLAIFASDAEPMMEHIDRQRETALLAALEASRSRTANETRQADAAAVLQSFFRMALQRRLYLRHKLTVSKQLRAIDKLRCCKAAMLLSRFCRGHMVRREYRMHRGEIASKRLDNMTRRMKIERGNTDKMLKVPTTTLVYGHCSQEDWIIDVLARYNVNFVNGVRCMLAGHYVEAIQFFDAHIKTSTVSAKEQSNEFLTDALVKACFDKLPAAMAAEMAQRNTKGRRTRR